MVLPSAATRITNVKVDFLKGFAKGVTESNDTLYHYMGRVTYNFYAEDNDEFLVDFNIYKNGTEEKLSFTEISGDIGAIKQKHTGDTLKTIYFRAMVTGAPTSEYVGKIEAIAQKNAMKQLARDLVAKMTVEQKQNTLFTNVATDVEYRWFGQDNITLSDGTNVVGWRCADGPHGIRYPLGEKNDIAILAARRRPR